MSRSGFRLPLLKIALDRFGMWMRAARTRRQLTELSDAALEDLGLSAEAARREAGRPFWDTKTDPWRRF